MKHSKRSFSEAGQSPTEKKPQKHDANLQKNSTLYFQVGLILCLLATYALFEMQFEHRLTKLDDDYAKLDESVYINEPVVFQVEKIKPKEVIKEVKRSPVLKDTYKVVDDITKVTETEITSTDDQPEIVPVASQDLDGLIEEPIEDIIVPFVGIEKAPVYPGCERLKTEEKRKQCFSDQITKLVSRKFNGDIATEYGLSGKQRIYTQFTIDKNGEVANIKVRAPHPALEEEAKRVVNKIPQMQPGIQRDIPVGVIYNLPITFQVLD